MAWVLLAAGLASALLAASAVPLVRRIALRTGFLDHPGPRKIHAQPIPYGGGLAVAAGVLGVLGAGYLATARLPLEAWGLPAEVARLAPGALRKAPEMFGLMGGALVILLLGLVDDKVRLRPGIKLLVQTLAAVGYVLGGERFSLFWEGSAAGEWIGGAVTVIWIVGMTNAMNLLDHMDGMAAGVTFLACVCLGAVAVATGQWFVAAALAALGGACLGFLAYNFPPASIFLGDAGSLLLGYLLAVLAVTFTFHPYERGGPPYAWAIPLAVLGVPLYDTATVVWIRWRAGRPIFEGDRNHLAHRLLALGCTPRGAVLTVYGMTLLTGLSAVTLRHAGPVETLVVFSQLGIAFGIITLLDRTGRRHASGPPNPPPP